MPLKKHTLGNLTVFTDDDFRNLPPALSTEELRQLADNIHRDGQFTDPIVCWNDGRDRLLVVDGHNRIDVWENRNGHDLTPPKVCCIELSGREAAVNWIIDRALGRRNLTDTQKAYLIGKRYNETKKPKGGAKTDSVVGDSRKNAENRVKHRDSSKYHSDTLVQDSESGESTAELIAEQTQTSPNTVKRAGKFQAAVDAIAKVNPKAAQDIKDGTLGTQKDAVAMAASDNIPQAIKNLRNGKKWDDGLETVLDASGKPVPDSLRDAFAVQDRFDATLKHLLPKLQEHALTIQDALYGDHRDDRKIPKSGFRAKVILDHIKEVHGMFQAFSKRYVCDCQNSCPKCHGRGWRK